MGWVLVIIGSWVGIAAVLAVLIARGIRLADRKAREQASVDPAPNVFVDDGRHAPPEVAPAPRPEQAPPAPPEAAHEPRPPDRTRHAVPRVRPAADEGRATGPEHTGHRSRRS